MKTQGDEDPFRWCYYPQRPRWARHVMPEPHRGQATVVNRKHTPR